MKVKLVNVADYEIKEEKVTNIPFNTFVSLCGEVGKGGKKNNVATVRLFKNIEDFKNLTYEEMEEMNQEENVKVLSNGQFLVFLKSNNANKKEIQE